MALFKPLVGDSSRISTDITPFHDGYVYLTPDDGGFYADVATDDENKRIRINPKSNSVNGVLSASGWSARTQTVSVAGLGAVQNGTVGLAQSATAEQAAAAAAANIRLTGQSAGSLTFTADGTVPTVDIPFTVNLLA